MRRDKIAFMVFLIIVLFAGCGKKKPTTAPTGPNSLDTWNAHSDLLLDAWEAFDSIAALGDTAFAISATISFLESSDQVDWAMYNGYEGISVCYNDGRPGFIITQESIRKNESPSSMSLPKEFLRCDGPATPTGVIPTKEGAGFYCPYDDELHQPYTEPICFTMQEELPKVGFPSPESEWGENVTPWVLASLSQKGMIHLQSHSYSYPSKDDIQEVYFVLTLEQDPEIDEEFADDINVEPPEPLRLIPGVEQGHKRYGIAPAFLAEHNKESWQEDKPVIWNGMCFGSCGTWPLTMISAGASAYLAWDWDVFMVDNLNYACKFYEFMCDTPSTDPFATTVAAYLAKYKPEYWDDDYNRMVCLRWFGNPFVSFQEPVEVGWTVGPHHPTFDWIGAAWDIDNDTLFIDFCNGVFGFPAIAIKIQDASDLREWSPVIPEFIGCVIEQGVSVYSNLYWDQWHDSRPCYVTFTEIELEPLGKLSGWVDGFVYDALDVTKTPVPISGSFENVLIYTTGEKILIQNNVDLHSNVMRKFFIK